MKMNQKIPDQKEIEELLEKIRPNPTERFHRKIQETPWFRSNNFSFEYLLSRQQTVVIISAIFVLGIILIQGLPSIHAMADRIARFFTSHIDNSVEIEIPSTLFSESETLLSTTLEEAVQQAGFMIKRPHQLPEGYLPLGILFNPDRKSITLNYKSEDGSILRITQRPAGIEYQSISVQAEVVKVRIKDVVGEYVSGGWKVTQPEEHLRNLTDTIQAVWDSDANIHFLRWQEDEILFEILFSSVNPDTSAVLDINDMISIAENLR